MATLHRKFPVIGTKHRTRVTAVTVLLLMVLSTFVPLNVLVYRNDDVTTRDLLDINSSLWSAQLDKTADGEPDMVTGTAMLNGLTPKLHVESQPPDNSTSTGGVRGTSTGGVPGTSTGGVPGTSTGGVRGTSTRGVRGTSTGGVPGTSTGGVPGTSTGGARGTSTGGVPGTSTGGVPGTSTGGVPGTSSAGLGGLQVAERITERPHHEELILDAISLPGIHTYLPHLKNKLGYLVPAVKISQNRIGVELVFGIPTIKRPEEDYLVETLNSLLSSIRPQDASRCLVIVFIAETNDNVYVRRLVAHLENIYSAHVASGLLEIIAPKLEFYPDFEELPITLGDTKERFRWRSKQNLDYAYLMLYAHTRGNFYIQLEDDVITKDGVFLFIMRSLLWHRKGWFSLNFSPLGFIGKLFRTADLPLVAEFLLMFYTNKPGDWLLDNLMSARVCGKNLTLPQCTAAISRVAKPIRPSQFQHMGYHSSLRGKVQLLKDTNFRMGSRRTSKVNKRKVNFNPTPTSIETTILEYKKHRIEYAYVGQGVFWGMTPSKDDVIDFIYEPQIKISGYALVSGCPMNARDVFPEDTTVELLVVSHPNTTQDQAVQRVKTFQVVGHFDQHGVAQASLPASLGMVGVFRIHVNSNMTTWVALSNISITV